MKMKLFIEWKNEGIDFLQLEYAWIFSFTLLL